MVSRLMSGTASRGQADLVRQRPSAWVIQLWIGLNLLDTLQTWLAIAMGAQEGNALIVSLTDSVGLGWGMVVKLLFGVMIGVVVLRKRGRGIWKYMNGTMVAVVVWNMFIMAFAQ